MEPRSCPLCCDEGRDRSGLDFIPAPSCLRPPVLTLDLADPDHVVAVPDLAPLLLRDPMLGVAGERQDRVMILPIDGGDAASIGISRRLDAEKAGIALRELDHALRHLR